MFAVIILGTNSDNQMLQSIQFFSVFCIYLCFTSWCAWKCLLQCAKQVGSQRKLAFVYEVFPACLFCKKPHSRHFQRIFYLCFVQNVFAEKGRSGCLHNVITLNCQSACLAHRKAGFIYCSRRDWSRVSGDAL